MSALDKFRTIMSGRTFNQDRHTPIILEETPRKIDVEAASAEPNITAEHERGDQDLLKPVSTENAIKSPSNPAPLTPPAQTEYTPQEIPAELETTTTTTTTTTTIETTSEIMPHSDTPLENLTPHAIHASAPRGLGPARKTDNLSNIRHDLAQLNEDMSTGEQFYAQSLKRISNLINYAYETEANLSALEHLEPENIRLKGELDEARKTATEQTVRAESFKSKADAYEARYLDSRQSLEKAQLSLTQMETTQEALRREIADKDVEISGLKNSNRTIQNTLTVDRQAAEKLSSKNLQLSSELSVAQSERLELEKRAADLQSRYEDLGRVRDELERMIAQTRSSHRATEEHNLALKTELEQVLADVQIFKKQFDATNRGKTQELNILRAKATDLEAEVAVKADVVKHAHDEMAELREKFDGAHRGRRKLLEHIETQKRDLDAMRELVNTHKSEVTAMSSKLLTQQSDNEELRRLNKLQSDKLKRYLAINTAPLSADTSPTRKPVYPERAALHTPVAPTPTSTPSILNTAEAKDEIAALRSRQVPDMIGKAAPSHDAQVERRSPTRPFQPAAVAPQLAKAPIDARAEEAARFGMVGGISTGHAMAAQPATTAADSAPLKTEFDRSYEELGLATPPKAEAVDTQSEAQAIEDALSSFHEIDLLEETGRLA